MSKIAALVSRGVAYPDTLLPLVAGAAIRLVQCLSLSVSLLHSSVTTSERRSSKSDNMLKVHKEPYQNEQLRKSNHDPNSVETYPVMLGTVKERETLYSTIGPEPGEQPIYRCHPIQYIYFGQ